MFRPTIEQRSSRCKYIKFLALGLMALFLRGGMAEHFKDDGFAEAGQRIEDPGLDHGFESQRGLAAREVHPEGGID